MLDILHLSICLQFEKTQYLGKQYMLVMQVRNGRAVVAGTNTLIGSTATMLHRSPTSMFFYSHETM